jgi:hypothetical protein
MVRQSDRSAVLAEAERPRAEGHDVEHAPHDAHVLEEMIELVLVLLRVHRPEVVEDECGRDEEQEDRECCPARLPAEDEADAATDLDDDGGDATSSTSENGSPLLAM